MLKKKPDIKKNTELSEYLSNLLGKEYKEFINALPGDRAIRINLLYNGNEELINSLSEYAQLSKLSFSVPSYKILNEKHPLSQTLAFFNGFFAFQGSSSQIPPVVLNPGPGERVLDMAASPGSKATQMGIMMENKGELIVNDSNLNRMQALNSNTQKAGLINHCIYYLAGERLGRLFPEYFDKVLLDSPCTGLGTLATKGEIWSWWSYKKLDKLVKIQKQLLISAIKSAKSGAEIVYSTCSVAPEENELLLNDILQDYPIEILPIKNKGMANFDNGFVSYNGQTLNPVLKNTKRVWPHRHNMEGFFVARMRKTAEYFNKNHPKSSSYINTLISSDIRISGILNNISESWGIDENVWKKFRYIKTRDRIWLLNNSIKIIMKEGFTNAGLLLAEERLNIWKLSHASVRFFANKIKKRVISLSRRQIEELFLHGTCDISIHENGYFVLLIEKQPAAMIYLENGKVKIKLPHPFNLP